MASVSPFTNEEIGELRMLAWIEGLKEDVKERLFAVLEDHRQMVEQESGEER